MTKKLKTKRCSN